MAGVLLLSTITACIPRHFLLLKEITEPFWFSETRPAYWYVFHNDKIYASLTRDIGCFFSCDLDGKNQKIISDSLKIEQAQIQQIVYNNLLYLRLFYLE